MVQVREPDDHSELLSLEVFTLNAAGHLLEDKRQRHPHDGLGSGVLAGVGPVVLQHTRQQVIAPIC